MFEIFRRVKHKKASLSLSINAIVVLVLAIAMLGLGLAFTKTMFKKFGEKLTVPPPDIPATSEEPVILPSDEITIKHGEGVTFAVNFYNDYNGGIVAPALECFGTLYADNSIGLATANMGVCVNGDKDCSTLAAPQNVPSGTYKQFKFIVPGLATTTENIGDDVCEIKFCAPAAPEEPGEFGDDLECIGNLETKQIVVKVI